jgi:HEAT repeat protein
MAPQVTKKRVVAALKADDYSAAQQLGVDAIPDLRRIAKEDDLLMAAQAAYLAGLIDVKESLGVIEIAARSRKTGVRVAAAAAAANLTQADPAPILMRLLRSRNPTVRRWALRSTASPPSEVLRPELAKIRAGDSLDELRAMAERILEGRTELRQSHRNRKNR